VERSVSRSPTRSPSRAPSPPPVPDHERTPLWASALMDRFNHIEATVGSSGANLSLLTDSIKLLAVSTTAKLGELDAKIDCSTNSLEAKMDEKFEELDQRIHELEGGRAAAEGDEFPSGARPHLQQPAASSKSPWGGPPITQISPTPQDSWDRVPDSSIIRVSTDKRAKVAIAQIRKSVLVYTEEKSFPAETYEISGPELGNAFSIKFNGLGCLASTQVIDFLRRIKNPDDSYYVFKATDPSGVPVTLHPNPDKNGRSQKLEGTTRRLFNHIKSAFPGLASKLFCRRGEGIISYDFKELVIVEVARRKSSLSWNTKLAVKCEINIAEENTRFEDSENIQWSG
jgi:hypothetical protein